LFDNLLPVSPYLIFILGALLGSFANVIIYRWPKKENIAWPGSRCSHCGHAVRFYDNIPILSWFILRGKCRDCGQKFSIRYPLVELLMASLFLLVWQVHGPTWTSLEYLILVFGLVAASFIDIDHFLLPDVITIPGTLIGLLGAYLNPERSFGDSLAGFVFGFGFLWTIAYLYHVLRKQDGMGGGDIKLIGWIGSVLGWKAIPFVIVVASIFGSVIGLALTKKGERGLKTIIPFGPYLALGTLLFVSGGENLAYQYLHWFIPEL